MCLKIQIVSGEPQFRQALRFLIEREADLVVVNEASDALQARAGSRARPDVVVVDGDLAGSHAIAQTIGRGRGRARVLMLSGTPTADAAHSALSAGASGFVSKLQPPRELLGALRVVGSGGSYLCQGVMRLDSARAVARGALDERELAFFEAIVAGKPLDAIARELGVSLRTATALRVRIARKLQLRSPGDLLRFAVSNGAVA